MVVNVMDISGWTANDTTYFVSLVERAAQHFSVREVAADKAYLSHKNLQAVSSVGGTAYAPFKSNTQSLAEDGSVWSQMYHFSMQNREEFCTPSALAVPRLTVTAIK
jgi:hypothetical protein